MTEINVTTQKQLDEALAKHNPGDVIVCLGGTWNEPLFVAGSSSVVAWGSSSVVAWGSSSVVARGSSSVEARDSSRVEAGKYVAIHKHPGHRRKINGGVVIEVPDVSTLASDDWCDHYGVKTSRGIATMFKALDVDLSTDNARAKGIVYTVGARIEAPDWKPTAECGNGLHVSPSPGMATAYNSDATRWVAVKARIADLVVIDDKAKTPTLTVAFECDRFGDKIEGTA